MITRTTVAAAVLSVMAGVASARLGAQAPTASQTTTASTSGPTFTKDVAPIFYKNCTHCHRPGEIAPMSLLTFKDARPWAKSIATQVAKGTMPPWHADPAHGAFLNDRRLSQTEKDTIVTWANAGAPEGNPSDLPAAPTYATEWLIGQPDAIFSMHGGLPDSCRRRDRLPVLRDADHVYRGQVDSGDGSAAGNPSVLHHVIVYARAPQPAPPGRRAGTAARRDAAAGATSDAGVHLRPRDAAIPAGQSGGPPLPPEHASRSGPNDRPAPRRMGPTIGGFAPGQFVRVYQDGTAMKLPAGQR